jgi:hypothetical protein
MNSQFDQHAINHMVAAIKREMTPRGGRETEMDTLFFGGAMPTEAEQDELGKFGFRKNYKVLYASFDLADVARGPIAFHVVVTDGLTQSIVLQDGRYWKRDRRSQAVLLFPGTRALIRLSSKGRLVLREMSGRYHDHGYDLARDAVLAQAGRKPGHVPVVSPIGSLVTVLDIRSLSKTFEMAE